MNNSPDTFKDGNTEAVDPDTKNSTAEPAVLSPGDMVIYPGHGLAEVLSIEEKNIADSGIQKFYIMRIVADQRKVMVPVGNCNLVGIRKPVDEVGVTMVMTVLKTPVEIIPEFWQKRMRAMTEKARSSNIIELAQVVRDLHAYRSQKRNICFSERRLYNSILVLLCEEIAHSRKLPFAEVKLEIENILLGKTDR
jgi:CarD family transcriptional regulator